MKFPKPKRWTSKKYRDAAKGQDCKMRLPGCGKQDVQLMPDYEIDCDEPDDDYDANYAVCCDINKGGCGATGGYNYEPCGAIALWNQRKE